MVDAISLELARVAAGDDPSRSAVTALIRSDQAALARVWLSRPGDLCGTCTLRAECPNRTRCLHLVASAGSPREPHQDWDGVVGRWKRIPLGIGKVGRVAANGTAVLLHDMSERSKWIVDPEWARREGLRSFVAQPLVSCGEVFGVLAVFRRARTDAAWFGAARAVADHLAAAIVRIRSRQALERTVAALEHENARLRAALSSSSPARAAESVDPPVLTIGEWRRHERENLEAALRRSGGRIYGRGGAADLLGMPPTTLASRLRVLGVAAGRRRPAPG